VNLVVFHFPSSDQLITMAPYCWVDSSFKPLLLTRCDDYMKANDHGSDKAQSKLITQVAQAITDKATEDNVPLPDDLEKVITLCIVLFTTDNWLV
jgi:hypothetical protein